MNGRDFYDRIQAHERFEWLGVREGPSAREAEVFVVDKETGYRHAVMLGSILDQPWEDLEAVLTGQREPVIMIHMTRIIGYYSQVRNWNGSMRAQLADRHKGDYAVL